jgi:hypothetical protein
MINNRTSSVELESGSGETGREISIADIAPVPLTDAVLQEHNFVYHDYFKFWQLIDGQEENRSEMDIDRDYNLIDFMRRPVVKKIGSLHQLQNVYFMLKGKELHSRKTAVAH